MEDLIARSIKYATGAGKIQEGQRRAAERLELFSRWQGWFSTVVTAVVGTSLFTKYATEWSLYLGIAAVVAAVLSALQRTSKLDERAEAHRIAGAEYGGLRRQADMLRLQLAGGDVTREEGLEDLKKITDDLSELAKRTRTLPDGLFERAKKAFKEAHQEYYASEPTHAGGVVFRKDGDTIQYLLVQAKKKPQDWVLPKGHIKPKESSEQAARREVLEETGIEASVWEALDTVEFKVPSGQVRSQFFLMEAVREGPPREGRERRWLDFDSAVQTTQFKEVRQLIALAYMTLRSSPRSAEPRANPE